ncbi:hypothetical protein H103_00971, partial [Trichophyton rubrum CBS 288.86]
QARVEARRIHKNIQEKEKEPFPDCPMIGKHNNFRAIKVGRQVREPQDPRKRKQTEILAETNWWREAAAFKLEKYVAFPLIHPSCRFCFVAYVNPVENFLRRGMTGQDATWSCIYNGYILPLS